MRRTGEVGRNPGSPEASSWIRGRRFPSDLKNGTGAMSNNLPMYPDAWLRGGNPFGSLDRAREMDLGPCFERFDRMLDHGEENAPAGEARRALTASSGEALLQVHRLLFPGRPDAGALRSRAVAGIYPGQDCPEPAHISRSLDNFETWLSAESFGDIHPVQQAALTLTRLVDIWPFDFGNRTTAVVFSNRFLTRAGYPPFFVLPGQIGEFEQILAQAIRIETEPLVRAIYRCIERELDLVRS